MDIINLATNSNTFLTDPSDDAIFSQFQSTYDPISNAGRVATLLDESADLKQMFAALGI